SGNLLVAGGSGSDSSAQIGLGGRNHEGDRSGGIFLDFGGAATVSAGTHTDSYAQIGHGSRVSPGNNTGDISLTTGGDIAVVAGDDSVAREARFAMIGHGGFTANG